MEPTAIEWWTLGLAAVAAAGALYGGWVGWRTHRATFERHDVVWEGRWDGPGRYVLENVGESAAHRVVALVSVDDETVRMEVDRVDPGGLLALDFPTAERELRREQAKQQAKERAGPLAGFGMEGPVWHGVRELVWWQSRRKVPHQHLVSAQTLLE